ncbi:hypothetical protein [Methylocystis bryophila]|uniref:hypothetical protein n=1 Tax=Methylocystis bryophila TaxID=655015 RepID=UPI00131A3B43|nr:hypothetical protein [Methylocystis bryophila]
MSFLAAEHRFDSFRQDCDLSLDLFERLRAALAGGPNARLIRASIVGMGVRIQGAPPTRDLEYGVGERKRHDGGLGLGARRFRRVRARGLFLGRAGEIFWRALGIVAARIELWSKLLVRRGGWRRGLRAIWPLFARRRGQIILDQLGDNRLERPRGSSLAGVDAAAQRVERLIQADAISSLVDELRDLLEGSRIVPLVRGEASRAMRGVFRGIVALVRDREPFRVVFEEEIVFRFFIIEVA